MPGVEGETEGYGYSVMDVLTSLDPSVQTAEPILFPAPGQKDVPLTFSSSEIPDPVPADFDRPVGTVLTAVFPPDDILIVDTGSFRVTEADSRLVLDIRASQSDLMHNVLYIIPKYPLQPDMEYRIEFQVDRGSSMYTADWTFHTISS